MTQLTPPAKPTRDEDRQAIATRLFDETHGSAIYLADNLASVTIERDEFAAEVDQLRAELDRVRRCPACQQVTHTSPLLRQN